MSDFVHPFPKEVAIAHCAACGEVACGRHVNQEDLIPPRYCALCGGQVKVGVYAFVRAVEPEPEKKKRKLPVAPEEP